MDGRYYNVTVTGDVQDIGFRKFIESAANSYHVRGYVFNDPDGSVKMLCGGSVESVNELFHAIQTRAPSGISIGQFVTDEIITDIDLNMPSEFLKLGTDEISDIGRKLDKGVKLLESLPDIKECVSILPDIKTGIDAMNMKFDAFTDEQRTFNQKVGSHTKRLDSYIEEQREHNKLVGAHNLRLEQILQKLVEK
ncbi:MAG: acylphosphatase [Euryarchaeota archaeon]|nr:acylphosphatase [Euryarchaeota archaeon]